MEGVKFIDSGSDFKNRHFTGEVIIGCIRWYLKYPISYRNLEEMMLERGIEVDYTTIYRWVQKYAPEFHKRIKWYSHISGIAIFIAIAGELMKHMSKENGNTCTGQSTNMAKQ